MQELIQRAKEIIEKRYKKGYHSVGSAVRTKSGKIYTGISINSQKVDICSEWSAISTVLSEGDSEIEMIVAVKRHEDGSFEIYPPCGLCRELYVTYCPSAKIIISETEVIEANKLLPEAWKKRV
ncbi:MAG: cytidine deaminase [Patescibacteria group bacterium]|nr:cytidine deaminase [Patescibacteria group bacterium]